MLRIAGIEAESIVDGPGIRFVLFLQGCEHRCNGCHNIQTWNKLGGTLFSEEQITQMIYDDWLITGVTFSGGEPFLQYDKLIPIAKDLKAHNINLWCYTGFLWEDVKDNPLVPYLDAIVDGPFIEAQKSYDCRFRGSFNQRIIDVQKSLASGSVVLLEP